MPISTIGQNGLNAPITLTSPVINTVTSASATALTLQSAGTTAITVDASQNVGIGTTSPAYKLNVKGGNVGVTASDGTVTTFVAYDGLYVTGSTASAMYLQAPTGKEIKFYPNATYSGQFDGSGNLLVGTTSPNGTEKFNVTSSSTEVAFFQNSSNTSAYSGIRSNIGSGGNNTSTWHFRGETRGVNNWYLYGNGTTSYSSDIRLKKNVQTARGYLEDLNKLRVVKYQWIGDNPDCQQVELGLIAQEVEEVFPNLIQEHEIEGVGDIKNIKQSVLPFMLLKAIQELKTIVDAQAAEIAELKAKVA